MTDVLGEALYDYHFKLSPAKLWIHNTYGKKEEMPVSAYFRSPANMPDLELIAMQLCTGKILDIGAGAGAHALEMQQKNRDVTALEISPKAVEVMKAKGVKNIVLQDIFTYEPKQQFDTLLLLMNGIGLAGTIDGLKTFLQKAATLINAQGQLIFDSSDIAYLYDGKLSANNKYYGEISYRYEYKKQKTAWFIWLYIDRQTLQQVAGESGWFTEVISEDEFDQYLVRLTRK